MGGAPFPGLGQLGVDVFGAGSGILQRGAGLLAKARSKGSSSSPSTRSSTVTRYTLSRLAVISAAAVRSTRAQP